jgi:hypothetical protein
MPQLKERNTKRKASPVDDSGDDLPAVAKQRTEKADDNEYCCCGGASGNNDCTKKKLPDLTIQGFPHYCNSTGKRLFGSFCWHGYDKDDFEPHNAICSGCYRGAESRRYC